MAYVESFFCFVWDHERALTIAINSQRQQPIQLPKKKKKNRRQKQKQQHIYCGLTIEERRG